MKEAKRKDETPPKASRERFVSLGSRVMSVGKEELDRRDKAWKAARSRRRK